jgi:hypothetical protein
MNTKSSLTRLLTPACALVLAAGAHAQKFNLDVGNATGNPVPAASFGGAAGQTGTWSIAPIVVGVASPIADVTGAATGATITMSGGSFYSNLANLPSASVDVLNLMSDIQDPETGAKTWTVQNLVAGTYDVYTYAMAPDDPTLRTDVSVAGSADPMQTVGGAWAGSFVLGLTHAKHRVVVNGGPLVITVAASPSPPGPGVNFGSVNGFQIVKIDGTGHAFCAGDGIDTSHTTPCPCANNGAAGNGCANSTNAAGAQLAASGSTTADNVVLAASGMPSTSSCIYLQGDALDDAVFGDGVRCTGGALVRLRTRNNAGGASTFPDSTDTVTLSARGGVTVGSGATRFYQTYYRNAAGAFCPPETFNVSNGWQITW